MVSDVWSVRSLAAIAGTAAALRLVQAAVFAFGPALNDAYYPASVGLIVLLAIIYFWTWRLVARRPGATWVLVGAILWLAQVFRLLTPLPQAFQQPAVLGTLQGAILLAPVFFAVGLLRSRLVPQWVSWLYVAGLLSSWSVVLGTFLFPLTQVLAASFLVAYAFYLIRLGTRAPGHDHRLPFGAAVEQAHPADGVKQ